MKLDEVCGVLARLERDNEVNLLTLHGFELWPLIRFCLWAELIQPPVGVTGANAKQPVKPQRSPGKFLRQAVSVASRLVLSVRPGVTSIFVSQPVNLQALPASGLSFDRILDPLMFLARNREPVEKFYVSPLNPGVELYFPARYLRPVFPPVAASYASVRDRVADLYRQAGLAPERVDVSFAQAWLSFIKWYRLAHRVFAASPDLNRVFLSSWYFPDMMGLIAAARELGIATIDVQHGKQGRYQGMYSWWTSIPPGGYRLMPDHFWCWGTPSCEHILASSPERLHHRPVAGGFAWPDFYRQYLSTSPPSDSVVAHDGRRVLVTLQGPTGGHLEPIPDFILEYLRLDASRRDVFVFRGHPNFTQNAAYCTRRLQDVPPERYTINDGSTNLYDELLRSTHHITAFSSCCYEAEMFGVPTLLFGSEAQAIYAEEIQAGRFAWIAGNQGELAGWLAGSPVRSGSNRQDADPYIVASLSHADRLLQTLGPDGTGGNQKIHDGRGNT
jgi:hypothetical protein